MCSEAHGLSGWPRKAARWVTFVAAALLALGALGCSIGLPVVGMLSFVGCVET